MKNLKLDLLTKEECLVFHNILMGEPTMDRVLVATVGSNNKTESGIILPKTEDNTIPKIATIVKIGYISPEYRSVSDQLEVGSQVYYGIYGGKVIEPRMDQKTLEYYKGKHSEIVEKLTSGRYEFSVLSINEILYVD